MGVSRKKELVAKASVDILSLMYYNGDGYMAQRHVLEYMKRVLSWSDNRIKTELKELLEYEIIERLQFHRIVFYRLSRYGKGVVLNKKRTSEFSPVSQSMSEPIKSLILNDYGLSMLPESEYKSENLKQFLAKVDSKTTIFYRQKEAYLLLKQYVKLGAIEETPSFKAEMKYLELAQKAGYSGRSAAKKLERPPIFHKQVTYHGIQQMNMHLAGTLRKDNKVVGFNFLFFQLNIKMTGAEVFEKIEKASDYLKLFLSIPEQSGVWLQFRVICNNQDTAERYQKDFEKHKKKRQINEVVIKFEWLDLDEKYFSGNRAMLNVQ